MKGKQESNQSIKKKHEKYWKHIFALVTQVLLAEKGTRVYN